MGQVPSGNAPGRGLNKDKDNKVCQKQMHSHFKKKEGSKKWEPPVPTRVGKKKKHSESAAKLPAVHPTTRCRLKLLKLERIKDHLLLEEEFVMNQDRLRPKDDHDEEERTRVDDLRGSPMAVGSLEEIIDYEHAIVSSSTGPEYYVGIMSFVDKDLLEPGCSVCLLYTSPSPRDD